MSRHTRFDPLHSAASEQSLRDQISDFCATGQSIGVLDLSLSSDSVEYQIQCAVSDLCSVLADQYQAVLDCLPDLLEKTDASLVQMGALASALPGIKHALKRLDKVHFNHLEPSNAAMNVQDSRQWLARQSEELHLIMQLPTLQAASREKTVHEKPTHILLGTEAESLKKDIFACLDEEGHWYNGEASDVNAIAHISAGSDGVYLKPNGSLPLFVNQAEVKGDMQIYVADHIKTAHSKDELVVVKVSS
ncbi:MAG: hypothetical protein KZQ58_09045 [gamma proteobacterium symbiont of Bathyaustriella thionipta]|nr:hypothetical protein [gamma proteobacterium symbiont of Bathyaustriella thionipta]